jgi:hypothetical protein
MKQNLTQVIKICDFLSRKYADPSFDSFAHRANGILAVLDEVALTERSDENHMHHHVVTKMRELDKSNNLATRLYHQLAIEKARLFLFLSCAHLIRFHDSLDNKVPFHVKRQAVFKKKKREYSETINEIVELYVDLYLMEHRFRGRIQPFEGIRILAEYNI